MLIEFTVTNFRSYREPQTLSMVQSKQVRDSEKLESHTFPTPDKKDLRLLRSAAIYGPNSSGKSNLIKALIAMQNTVTDSAGWQRGRPLPMDPHQLSAETKTAPCEFDIIFYADGVRYQYGFSATKERVLEEWLYAYPSGRQQSWIERMWDNETQSYQWGRMEALKGQKKLWKDSTRGNALFLSVAVLLNCEQLKPVFDWFNNTLRIIGMTGLAPNVTAQMCKDEEARQGIADFLKVADINITGIEIESRVMNDEAVHFPDDMPSEVREHILEQMRGREHLDIRLTHETDDGGEVSFRLDQESDGTQKLFEFAGPWFEAMTNGYVLFVDELHDNFHPLLVRLLVSLFQSKGTSYSSPQLVFTTHDTSILSQDIFRRDQVWFAAREPAQGTELTPLSDFSVRKGSEDIERYYLEGRYGAIPYIPYFADVASSMRG